MNEIGGKIKELMRLNKVSYRDLATKTGIPKSALQRYITGETEKIPIDRVELIAKVFNVTASYLIGWNEEPAEEPEFKIALLNGSLDISDSQWEEVYQFAKFIAGRNKEGDI